jgi:hypothetical protein
VSRLCFFCDESFGKVTVWKKTHFNPVKTTTSKWARRETNPEEHRHQTEDQLMEVISKHVQACEDDKNRVKLEFDRMLEGHYKLASKIAGIVYYPRNTARRSECHNQQGVAQSLIKDCSGTNIKKVCWLLHYSTNNVYTGLFGMAMGEYCEAAVMRDCMVKYEEGINTDEGSEEKEEEVRRGCVGIYCNQRINNFRSNLKERVRKNGKCKLSMCVNFPKGATGNKPKMTSNSIVWVKKGEEAWVKVTVRWPEKGREWVPVLVQKQKANTPAPSYCCNRKKE